MVEHPNNVPTHFTDFYKQWKGLSSIYKLTFLRYGYLIIVFPVDIVPR